MAFWSSSWKNLQIQPIVFSTDSFRTSPEQDSPSTMTSEMFVMMTDKQTKPEGSSGAKGLQLVLSLHPHFQDMTVVESCLTFWRENVFLSIP